MRNRHHCPIFCHGINLILFWNTVFFYNQRMISGYPKMLRKSCKKSGSVMMNLSHLSMHWFFSLFHSRTTTVSQYLMSQTDSQNRDFSLKALRCLHTELCIPGTLRSRRQHNSFRMHPFDLIQGNLITPLYQNLPPQFLKIGFQIVYKRIIIINHQIHMSAPFRQPVQYKKG